MLSAGDEYPIHQTPEPVAFAGSDRNFYDRFFFNGYNADGSVFFACALGVYPHLNIMDAAVSVLREGRQSSVFFSRPLGMERMDTQIGRLRVEVVEPLNRIRVSLEETEGIALDLLFTGRAFPIEEPRFTYRQGPRMLIDCTRMTQNGHWSGSLSCDGQSHTVEAWAGTRDRSWGVRPIGAQDPQPLTPAQLPQFYWLWTPLNFENQSVFFHVNDDRDGQAWNTRAVIAKDGEPHQDMAACQADVSYRNGTRRVTSATLDLTDVEGESHRVRLEPFSTFLMKGIGYGHPTLRHGAYQGEQLAIMREDYTPDEAAWQQPENLHIQALSRVTYTGPDGQPQSGMGTLEQLLLGPHSPSGWSSLLDA